MNFLNPYSPSEYKKFFQDNLLTDSFRIIEEEISLEFKPQFINKAELIGRDKSLELAVYEIQHESENDPRVGLSKDFFRLMANYGSKRALAIFYSPKSKNYRLSLATVDLSLEGSKVKREYSNPRRYSFFLGPDAKVHTPSEFLIKKGRVSTFDELQERFSVEVVNKEFYQRIAIQFSRLTGGKRKIGSRTEDFRRTLSLPSVSQQNIFQEFAVRLIGRLVFCWFLKMKKSNNGKPLISDSVLSLESVKLKNNYYHDVLEKLFFEVLNTPIEEREKIFKQEPYLSIPFLNGGLFNPHSYDFYEVDREGVSKHLNTLKIPDKWLQDFIEILETYNFTVDENTSVDIDLSVDPEMLGRIFENLLAEINPETGESARKATGSYYTPRPIVEYMVDESLKQYLKTETDIDENRISNLLSYSDGEIDLSDKEKEKIIDAFDKVKILDPACGSGAFPIGILQKMLLVLKRVDPKSQMWLNKQLERVPTSALRNELKKKLQDENVEYIHKLGIIQNSIYGVDIQPIAAEISKLRCFLSLIVDEKIYDDKDNRGVLPLPNLEFKFVAANTLIPLPKSSSQSELFNVDEELQNLEELRKQYFTAVGKQKSSIEDEFLKTQKELVSNYFRKQAKDDRAVKLANWNPFSDDASEWFDPEWMFGSFNSFNILIGNPPYGIVKSSNTPKEILKKYQEYYSADFKVNLFALFLERGLLLSAVNCINSFIIPDSSLNLPAFKKLREYILKFSGLKSVSHYNEDIFENAAVGKSVVLLYAKLQNVDYFLFRSFESTHQFTENKIDIDRIKKDKDLKFVYKSNEMGSESLLDKLKGVTRKLNDYCDVYDGINPGSEEIKDTLITMTRIDSDSKKIIDGKCFAKYSKISWEGSYIYYNTNFVEKLRRKIEARGESFTARIIKRSNFFVHPKIVTRQTADTIIGTIDNEKYYVKNSVHSTLIKNNFRSILSLNLILGILNSKLIEWYYRTESLESGRLFPQVKIERLRNLPVIIPNSKKEQTYLESLVEDIIAAKAKNPEVDLKHLEAQIDIMVYKLYNLTYEEVKIIDPEIEKIISEKEYEKYIVQ